jgi:predicted PurR-regulated permease PerM
MGDMTGLNPVWIIVALFVGGKLGGVLGLLIAVPLASVLKATIDNVRAHSQDDAALKLGDHTHNDSLEIS